MKYVTIVSDVSLITHRYGKYFIITTVDSDRIKNWKEKTLLLNINKSNKPYAAIKHIGKNEFELNIISVPEEFQRKGIGKSIIRYIIDEFMPSHNIYEIKFSNYNPKFWVNMHKQFPKNIKASKKLRSTGIIKTVEKF